MAVFIFQMTLNVTFQHNNLCKWLITNNYILTKDVRTFLTGTIKMHKPKIQRIIPQREQSHLIALVVLWCNAASTILGMIVKESSLWTLLSKPAGAAERDSPFSVFEMLSRIFFLYSLTLSCNRNYCHNSKKE